MADTSDSRLVVTFENFPVLNEAKSKEANRPIYEDLEVCRIRMAGDRQQAPVFPANAEAPGGVENADGYLVTMTYAEKYAEQYRKFKAGEQQTKEGTPLEAVSFLTPARVKEFKALNIYTVEALASLEGSSLKSIGSGGTDFKLKAQAYLDSAAGSADVSKLTTENEFLKQQLEELTKERAQYATLATERVTDNLGYGAEDQIESKTDAELRDMIKDATGAYPRGQPSRETLIGMVKELQAK
jgi:hypothetical protein